ncbi:cytochrome b pre-mRNA-processing protein 3 [Breoghania corrubedonensis]|uniref:Cytochrome b pre-mRNA-processing protein 3 n=1 Tax=Breoghania corrubedonensis TaxID=665038 RepID=A0A2T5VAB7_9HYPH|nr:ubiquinol-cytochrome C chaperone family protein [Breoghania corrubedonensis]PTW60699.1 cytochrome b pre-mRNA-processing protein 3 [Breoghania corrubedonensis]
MVFSLFRRREDEATRDLYAAIVAQARQPHFFARLCVPDTIDGRFDMIALHATLMFARLKGEGEAAKARAQDVFDTFFRDMDHALRELGASDTSVPRKVTRMAELFYGAADAYMSALGADTAGAGDDALVAALGRNVYGGDGNAKGEAEALARYVRAAVGHLAAQQASQIVAGRIAWVDPAPFVPREQKAE